MPKILATKRDELEAPGLSPVGANILRNADAIQNHKVAVSDIFKGLDERAKSIAVASHCPFKFPGRVCAS